MTAYGSAETKLANNHLTESCEINIRSLQNIKNYSYVTVNHKNSEVCLPILFTT